MHRVEAVGQTSHSGNAPFKAARWAAASMPSAMPLTSVQFNPSMPPNNPSAADMPKEEARLVPTTDTILGLFNTSNGPRTNKIHGATGTWSKA